MTQTGGGEITECDINSSSLAMPASIGPVAGRPEAETTGPTAKQLERIKRNKEQAKIKKTTRLVDQAKILWAPALANDSNPGGDLGRHLRLHPEAVAGALLPETGGRRRGASTVSARIMLIPGRMIGRCL